MTQSHSKSRTGDVYLSAVQFFFLLGWSVYVIYLGDLAARAGLPKQIVPWLVLLDQLIFICADIALGFYADRILRASRNARVWLVGLSFVSCLLLIGLPHLAVSPALLVGLALFWVATSSVLRAPLYGLIAQRSLQPARHQAAALLGLGLAAALSPYLGVLLKGVDPALPFLLAGASLALAVTAFIRWEREQPAPAARSFTSKPQFPPALRVALLALLLGGGFQLHNFVNSAVLFQPHAQNWPLHWLLPVFWIGFSLAIYPGSALIRTAGALRVLRVCSVAGTLALAGCLFAEALPGLMVLQLLAGAAWAGVFLSALALAASYGHDGREALFTGMVFAGLALATAGRVVFGLSDLPAPIQISLPLAAAFVFCGAILALSAAPENVKLGESTT
jgi:MFS family permease